MPYFEPAFLQFFAELETHNHREWFLANKQSYESAVKEPFRRFVQDLIEAVNERGETIQMDAKDAIFRINRDVRFSKDKAPYKTQMSALISAGGKKSMDYPGLYVELSVKHARVYSGAYQLDKEPLHRLRQHIATYPERFAALLTDARFAKTFGEIQGEKNKRIPKELEAAAKDQPLIYNKNFYYYASFPPDEILKNDWLETVLSCYEAARPMGAFIIEAFHG